MSPQNAASTHISTAECWKLLESHDVGRLALVDADNAPDIFPVNFVAYEGALYLRTAPDVKDVALVRNPECAFEIDGHDGAGWWSVVVRGAAARVDDPVEVERSGVGHLRTASPRHKPHVLRIAPRAVTGRRFADRAADEHVSGRPTGDVRAPAAAHDDKRPGSRPHPIPSRPPRGEGV